MLLHYKDQIVNVFPEKQNLFFLTLRKEINKFMLWTKFWFLAYNIPILQLSLSLFIIFNSKLLPQVKHNF